MCDISYFDILKLLQGAEVPQLLPGESLVRDCTDITYVCPFTGPVKGNLYLTNYKLVFSSKDRSFDVPLGVVMFTFVYVLLLEVGISVYLFMFW